MKIHIDFSKFDVKCVQRKDKIREGFAFQFIEVLNLVLTLALILCQTYNIYNTYNKFYNLKTLNYC